MSEENDGIAALIAQFIADLDSQMTTIKEELEAVHRRITGLERILHVNITELREALNLNTEEVKQYRRELECIKKTVYDRV